MEFIHFVIAVFILVVIIVVIMAFMKKDNTKRLSQVRPWTQEEINNVYNLIISGPESEFIGCTDFAQCYVDKLQRIASYDDLINQWDNISDSIREMVGDARDDCKKVYPCHKSKKSKSNKNSLLKF